MALPQSLSVPLGTEGPDASWKRRSSRLHQHCNDPAAHGRRRRRAEHLEGGEEGEGKRIQPDDKTLNGFKKKMDEWIKKSIKENHQCHACPSAAWITWFGDPSAQWEDALVPLISW